MGLADLPKSKWGTGTGRQVILKGDFAAIEAGLFEVPGLIRVPPLVWVDNTQVRVEATADCPAGVLMLGFPNIMQPGNFIAGGLSDGKYRMITGNTSMDFDTATTFWGNEKSSQWYAVYAVADDEDTAFTLKAMPVMRVKSQATQTISMGTNVTPATGIGYGLTTDELVGSKILMLYGSSRGLVREITANNNDNSTGGTITYDGDALTVAAGDWFIVLPYTNFRWLGNVYNNASGHIAQFRVEGRRWWWSTSLETSINYGDTDYQTPFLIPYLDPLATRVTIGPITTVAGYFSGDQIYCDNAIVTDTGRVYVLRSYSLGGTGGMCEVPINFCRHRGYPSVTFNPAWNLPVWGYEHPEGYL